MLRWVVTLALIWLLAASAKAASPTIDGAVGATVFENDTGNITSVSGVLTTSLGPDKIVCVVAISNPQGSANTLTGCAGTGLTFNLRKRYPNNMGSNCAVLDVNPCNMNVEVWEAPAAAPLAGVTITANFASQLCHSTGLNNGCRASFVAFGVAGATGHDPGGALPNVNFSAADVAILSGTYITTLPDDLLLWYYGSAATGTGACGGGSGKPSSFTSVGLQGIGSNCLTVAYRSVSATVNTTYGDAFDAGAWGIVGDAFTSDAIPPSATTRPNIWINQ